jgi:sialate O-acetylesterase
LERDYKIPKKILKKGKNILAIRVTDLGGPGGFNSPVLLKSPLEIRELPLRSFKYRHEAFITTQRSFIVKHNYSSNELIEKTQEINDKLREGYLIDDPNAYSMQFDKMLSPILPYGIKGAIWYQGEANVVNYNEYQELFTGMIEDWRDHWGYDFSFYYVQIAPFDYAQKSERSHELRDAQRKSLKVVSNTGMAILLDIGEKDDIHPANKQDVGKRLALFALDNDYNFDLVSSGPLYKNHVIFKDYIQVDFDNTGSGLVSRGILKDFEIAGADSIFLAAKAEIVNNKVRVWSNKVNTPIHVRYGWKNWMVGTLFNKEKLPASSFNSINGN